MQAKVINRYMRNLKRIFTVILTIFVLSALCGCSGSSISSEGSVSSAAEQAPASASEAVPDKKTDKNGNINAASDNLSNTSDESLNQNTQAVSLKVHFIDVGQGDSEFIELPDGTTMLIDSGEADKAEALKGYIKGLGYEKINYIIASHPHSDHIGGMADILNSFAAEKFFMPKAVSSSSCFENMLKAVQENGCKAEYITAGKVLAANSSLGFSITAVAPVKEYKDLNNSSAVLRLTYKSSSFLFTGDAEAEAEQDIISNGTDVHSDVLKAGHHGSSSSSSKNFLAAVSPKYAVISCGSGNSYGHPHAETISKLKGLNVQIYRTDLLGSIICETNGYEYKIYANGYKTPEGSETVNTNAPVKEQSGDTLTASENIPLFKTKTGKAYHRENCQGLKNSKLPITLEEARTEGLTPCKTCKPPA